MNDDYSPTEDIETPPSGEGTPEPEGGETIPSGEEEDRKPSKKSAEARIGELLSENKQLEERLSKIEEGNRVPLPSVSSPEMSPEVQRAVDRLKELGFVHKEELDKRVSEIQNRMVLDSEHTRLESQYTGEDGRPKYSKSNVEKFMREKGIFDAEVAYKTMNEMELLDWHVKQASRKEKAYSAPPAAPSSNAGNEQAITREKIAEWMKTREGRARYEQNRDKILSLMAQGKLE